MSDLYLIAHKVRGEATFDIAERMVCPLCVGKGCDECDDCGYWWEVSTSGHRAYAYWYEPLKREPPPLPFDWPDHYPLRHTPSAPRVDILSLLPRAAPGPTIRRRL